MLRKFFAVALVGIMLAGCNKDDVIIDDGGGDTPAPAPADIKVTVVEYLPAPGQFIGDMNTGGFTGSETTMTDAVAYANGRLEKGLFVSLGAFGGSIVFRFDSPVTRFAISGNAFDSSNEPGIVSVMVDSNGNGEPDDTWYELCNSETGAEGTIPAYSVTYYRPDSEGSAVRWTDSEGNEGKVAYLASFHNQPSYYPTWVSADSYTLTGTCVTPRNYRDDATRDWINPAYGWGFVDNCGSDVIADDGNFVAFSVDNAIDGSGKSVKVGAVTFVRVHTAVQTSSGWLGESSTEVTGIKAL